MYLIIIRFTFCFAGTTSGDYDTTTTDEPEGKFKNSVMTCHKYEYERNSFPTQSVTIKLRINGPISYLIVINISIYVFRKQYIVNFVP